MKKHSEDIRNWLKVVRSDGIGPATFAKLKDKFGSVDTILGTSVHELTKIDGIGEKIAEKIARSRDKFDSDKELELANKLGVAIIHLNDPQYPPVLKQIYDPPPILYIKGTLTKNDNLAIAIVGARRCSYYGSEQSGRFAHLLASAGFTIVSGMARGIDTAAHTGALAAKGRTIAVQGCGLAKIFPPENKKLFNQICSAGACISELPLEYEPLAENFPSRNRIIAGLSLGTIVVEAFGRSGALITARAALDYNREVMAVPGKIDSPLSGGPHRLIKDGAKLVESVEDVTEALGYIGQSITEHVSSAACKTEKHIEKPLFEIKDLNLSSNEKAIIDSLNSEPMHIENVIAQTSLSAGAVNASLVSLRLKGLTKELPGSFFVKR